MNQGVLAGMRVVEVSAFVAAPLGGMTLAQLGADVIRIDLPGGGLDYRRWPVTEQNASLFWRGLNKGKRSVCLDFTQPEGRELAIALITAPGEDSGLFLTNFPARGWLDYESLREKRPDLIQLTIQGDRQGGSAVDYTVNPAMGLPNLTGATSSDEPVNHILPAWDLLTGQMAATGLLAAERHRRRTGAGQHIKLALEDVALATMGNLGFIAEAQLGQRRERVGNYLFGAFGRDFLCSGGERVMVVGLTAKQWTALVRALDLSAEIVALQDELRLDLGKEGNRFLAREAIAGLVAARIGSRSMEEIARDFDRNGVCWSRYQTVRELVANDPACSDANPMFASIAQPGVGRVLTPTVPLDFSLRGRLPPMPAPELGEHTGWALRELLGLSISEIEQLRGRGVIGGSQSQ
jgi:2-methylfumaryl-CoA isomerase